MAKPKPKRHAIADHLADLERQAEERLPGSDAERVELWSWCSIEEREQLEAELVDAPDGSDAELAALMRCEAALLVAQSRRAAGWPREWWCGADRLPPEGHPPG